MSDNTERWIIIPRWDDFQHPDVARSTVPPWIKLYTRLLDDDDYLRLTNSQRGILHGLWILYARHKRVVSESVAKHELVRNAAEARHWRDNLVSLNQAGWITISASNPASKVASNLQALEVEKDLSIKERSNQSRARETVRPQPSRPSQPGRTNLPQRVTADVLERWIRAGAIPDLAVLEHELKEAGIVGNDAERLRALLPQPGTHEGPVTLGSDLYANH